jgi:4'-phosphopantetheinyl transferase
VDLKNMNGLHLHILSVPECADITEYENMLHFVSEKRQERIRRFLCMQDRLVSLFTGLFVRYRISAETGIYTDDLTFEYGEYGKPYLQNVNDYYFSVSHASNMIAFASSDDEIGIDIETSNRTDISFVEIADLQFTSGEAEYIRNSVYPEKSFLEIWTRKEAYVKCSGRGLSQPLDSFDVLNKLDRYKIFTLNQNGFIVSVCCTDRYDNVSIVEHDLKSLLNYWNKKSF